MRVILGRLTIVQLPQINPLVLILDFQEIPKHTIENYSNQSFNIAKVDKTTGMHLFTLQSSKVCFNTCIEA